VTRASRLCGGNVIGLGGEESTTWKPSRLQGVGPIGMPADDPKRRRRPPSRRGRIGKPTTGAVWPEYIASWPKGGHHIEGVVYSSLM